MQVIFVVVLWSIWKERCHRQFRANVTHKLEILTQIMLIVQGTFQGNDLKEVWAPFVQKLVDNWNISIRPIESKQSNVSWRPPDTGWVKSNLDGALSSERVGFGAVLRNQVGALLGAVAVQEARLQLINILEFKAILHELKMSIAKGLTKVHMESDSMTAIAWVLGRGCIPWRAFRDQSELRYLLPLLKAWKASHVFREGNQVADHLA
ncbi:hypothetical protein QJS10_CPB13g01153 [Acorus calamus]|uniref:RNase H type-1 domain-containing protein n=1 Tax=Acorus calamus TaxID=4465 RepID=A0AAV9DJI4_ACOCL|nr:hypothetical protein QJS10_CPB13g01153 [Acorus calamus]